MTVLASSFSQNTDLNVGAFAVYVTAANADWHFYSSSFDSDRFVIGGGTVTTIGCHFEDVNNKLTTTALVQAASPGGNWTSIGDFFLTGSTTNPIINWSHGNATILGRWTASGTKPTAPAFVLAGGSANVSVEPTSGGIGSNISLFFRGTSTGVAGVLPMPETASSDRGDASIALMPMKDHSVQIFNTPLTGARTFTLPTSGLGSSVYGATFTIVRTANATGAFNLTAVGGTPNSALTAAGQWIKYQLRQDGTWQEVAHGTL
jgi:hypothetical protein